MPQANEVKKLNMKVQLEKTHSKKEERVVANLQADSQPHMEVRYTALCQRNKFESYANASKQSA